MRFLEAIFALILVVLLSHCATKHQPSEFPAYFSSRPEYLFSREQTLERAALEALPSLTSLQKRRLVELYSNEMRGLKSEAARNAQLKAYVDKLRAELKPSDDELANLQAEVLAKNIDQPPASSLSMFRSPALRKNYLDTVQMWNRDDSAGALRSIENAFNTTLINATNDERVKWEGLRLRIYSQDGDVKGAAQSLKQLRSWKPCDADTVQAALLVALLQFGFGDSKAAEATFAPQCEPEDSEVSLLRHKYWMARFQEANGQNVANVYLQLAGLRIPSYYGFMSQIQLKRKITLPAGLTAERAFLAEPFETPPKVHELLLAAEQRLKNNLRKEAVLYLTKASQILRRTSNPELWAATLYTAHLCHAAGNHLEAMKLYTQVSELVWQNQENATYVTKALFDDMYPRPFRARVEWLSQVWNVDPDFVYAIIRQESAFNPMAVSSTDARGLMQLMPWLGKVIAKQWGAKANYSDRDLFVAEANLKFGIFYLHQVQGFVPHLALAAASYNAGIQRVMRWWKRYGAYPLDVFVEMIPVNETRGYVKLVMRNYFYYKLLRTGAPVDPNVIPFGLGIYPDDYASYTERDVIQDRKMND